MTPATTVNRRSELAAAALVLLSALSFASISIVVLLALRTGVSLPVLMQWRFVLAAAVLALVVRSRLRLPLTVWLPLFAVGVVGQAAVTYVSLSALRYVRPAVMSFLFFTYPAWLAAGAAAVGSTRFTRARILALILALAGVAIILRPGSDDLLDLRGVALGLTAAVLYAVYLPALSRAQHGAGALTAAFYVALGAALSFAVGATLFSTPALPRGPYIWALIGFLAIVSTVLAFALLIAGVRILGAVRTSIIGTTEPFFTTLLAALVLGDPIRGTTLLGGSLIAAAVVISTRSAAPPAKAVLEI